MVSCGRQYCFKPLTTMNVCHQTWCCCRRLPQQHFMAIAGSDTAGLADSLPVSAINKAAAVLESALERRLFPIRCCAADPRLCTCCRCRLSGASALDWSTTYLVPCLINLSVLQFGSCNVPQASRVAALCIVRCVIRCGAAAGLHSPTRWSV